MLRADWVNEAKHFVRAALAALYQVRLAETTRQEQIASLLSLRLENVLRLGMFDLLAHPVKREFDRNQAFEEALRSARRRQAELRLRSWWRFARIYGHVGPLLTSDDTVEFWKVLRERARLVTG